MNTQNAPKPSIRNLFDILFKRKKVILLFFFLSLCAAWGAALLMKPVYRATAQLLFKPGREDIPVTAADRILTAVRFDREEQVNSEIEIIRSRSLLEKTLQSVGLTSAYTKLLEIELESGIQGPDLEKLLLDRAVMNLQRDLQVEGVREIRRH